MIFLSKKQFQENYSDLIYVFDLFLKENFAETSQFNSFKKLDFSNTICSFIFNHLLNFIKWNKYNDMTFFCKEANDYLISTSCIVEDINFNCDLRPDKCTAKFRYRAEEYPVNSQ